MKRTEASCRLLLVWIFHENSMLDKYMDTVQHMSYSRPPHAVWALRLWCTVWRRLVLLHECRRIYSPQRQMKSTSNAPARTFPIHIHALFGLPHVHKSSSNSPLYIFILLLSNFLHIAKSFSRTLAHQQQASAFEIHTEQNVIITHDCTRLTQLIPNHIYAVQGHTCTETHVNSPSYLIINHTVHSKFIFPV